MNLSQFCIRRPVFTIALNLVIVIIGIISFTHLSVRELPNINNQPVITISVDYGSASANLMEKDVTTPIENAIAAISGVSTIESNSTQGHSAIIIRFHNNYDVNVGMNEVRDKLSSIVHDLPRGIETPVISKNDTDSSADIYVAVTDSKRSALQITDYIKRSIEPLMQQVEGVSSVNIVGERLYSVNVALDPTKMAAKHVTVGDVKNTLESQNGDAPPAGKIKGADRDYPFTFNARLQNVAQFNDLIVRDDKGMVTRLKDIAQVNVDAENKDSAFRINGKSAVALAIIPGATANPIDVAYGVKEAIKKINVNLPPSMKVELVYNSADFIQLSIHEIYRSLLETLILVIVIVFLFLGSIRSTLIPIVTIPVCLIAICTGLYAFSFSINTITLLAMVLAIGLVVDDAIVMLENIYRYIENGMTPFAAAMKGSKEIIFAIIAMTLTLVAVYFPITFIEGLTGILFREFALTLAGTVVISGFVALTLSPMMSARLLRPVNNDTRYSQWLERFATKLVDAYRYLLMQALRYRLWVIAILIILASLGGWLYIGIPTELAPVEDRGIIHAEISPPTNSSFAYVNRYAKQIESIYAKIPQARSYLIWLDPSSAGSLLLLKPWNERQASQQQVSEQLQEEFNKVPGVLAYASISPPFGSSSSKKQPIVMNIMSSESYKNLSALTFDLIAQLQKYPGLDNILHYVHNDKQQFDVNINRHLAADLGVNLQDISATMASFIGGEKVSKFEFDGRNYNVIVQMQPEELKDLKNLDKIYLRSTIDNNKMIPLSSLITITPVVIMSSLYHYDRLRSMTITAQLAPGYSLGQAVGYLQKFMKTRLPTNASYALLGSAKDFLESRGRMKTIFLLALVFIYLVLAAQFESFIDPLIVLFSVPLSIVGGLFVLRMAGGTLNIYSQIGLVTLIGLIAKHGILITEFANQLRAQGKDIYDAIVEASALRLRPILMTTSAMALGALPLALASGAGAASRQQVGWVIMGGILFGTFFSLFVVPTAYLYFAKLQRASRFTDSK